MTSVYLCFGEPRNGGSGIIEGPIPKVQLVRSVSVTPSRDFSRSLFQYFGLLGYWWPVHFLVDLEKESAIPSFQRQTFVFKTAQEDSAIRSVERKEIGFAEKIAALFVLFLQRFRILAKKTLGQRLAGQSLAGEQQQTLARLFLINGITVAVPCRRQSLTARLAQKLLQHFLPAEFAHHIFFELGPIRP